MVKLNKNQKLFFSSAVEEFGLGSTDVRLKDLRDFSIDKGLIVPTTALKKYCQRDDLLRGHYDLTLTGYEPEPPKADVPLKKFEDDNPILEMSVFGSPQPVVEEKKVKKKRVKKLIYRNPIYLILEYDGGFISAHKSPKSAYKKILSNVLHDHGKSKVKDVIEDLDYEGYSTIESGNSGLHCFIQKVELED